MRAQAWWDIEKEDRLCVLFADRSTATYFVCDGEFRSKNSLHCNTKEENHYLEFMCGAFFYHRRLEGRRLGLHLPIVSFTIPNALHELISSCHAAALERNLDIELCDISQESCPMQELAMREHDEQALYSTLEELHAYVMQELQAQGKPLQRSAPPVPEEYHRRQEAAFALYREKFHKLLGE